MSLTSSHGDKAIGGYFELELRKENFFFPESALYFQSARAAFRALLRTLNPTKVWMPNFICDGMISPLHEEEIEIGWYDIDQNFKVLTNIELLESQYLLYVDYFSISKNGIECVLQNYSPNQIILDYSHAFFNAPRQDVLATIYSPRKFFGVPDGGILITNSSVDAPKKQDHQSISRMQHLLKRLDKTAETGYSEFQKAEMSLEDTEPLTMSRLTEKILWSIDYDTIRKTREKNFSCLHERLKKFNTLTFNDASFVKGPLCYPFRVGKLGLKDHLISNRVYIPTYWSDALPRVNEKWRMEINNNFLALPIDQRYGQSDMEYIVGLVEGYLK